MKIDKSILKQSFHEARIIFYVVFFTNGLIVYKFKPYQSLCDNGTKECIFCNMRCAVDKLFDLDFIDAYRTNEYIIVLIAFGLIAALDTIFFATKTMKQRKLRSTNKIFLHK